MPNGNRYLGVTSVLKKTEPPYIKAILNNWRKKIIREFPDSYEKELKRGSDRGSYVHDFFEKYLLSNKDEKIVKNYNEYEEFIAQAKYFCDREIASYCLIEGAVWDDDFCYSGTLDALYYSKDAELTLMDLKTSSKEELYDSQLETYKLQIASYAKALEKVYPVVKDIGGVEVARIVVCNGFTEYPVTYDMAKDEIEDCYKRFISRLMRCED